MMRRSMTTASIDGGASSLDYGTIYLVPDPAIIVERGHRKICEVYYIAQFIGILDIIISISTYRLEGGSNWGL